MQGYRVEWECISCGQQHSFRYGIDSEDTWPNKFEVTCENPECGQTQDVPMRKCVISRLEEENP